MATECRTQFRFEFQRKLVVGFDGGAITSDAGLVLLREFDERLGITVGLKRLFVDRRQRRKAKHPVLDLLRQRIYQIAAGYSDGNDATHLRHDPTMRTIVRGSDEPLGSQPTLSRFENDTCWETIRRLERRGLDLFCAHDPEARNRDDEIILDMDSSCDPTHGQQSLSFFNGHYNTHMYHPLFVFEARSGILLASCLRPGDVSGIRQLLPLLRPTVTELKRQFPKRRIALRGDADFAKPTLLDYADYAGCLYAFGMASNSKLRARIEGHRQRAEKQWTERGEGVRMYTSFFYKAHSWPHARRIAAKVEYGPLGSNIRFVVTNRRGSAEEVFNWYEQRGQAENFIKELKRDVEADRLSCSAYHANAFRLQLHGLAYNLLVLFRRRLLPGTQLANATIQSVRLRLFKLGARVSRSVRRLCFHLASDWPGQPLFQLVVERLALVRGPT